MTKIVLQEDLHGCGPACAATVLGKTYSDVTKDFLRDFSEEGMSIEEMLDYLGNSGCSIVYKHITHYAHINFARGEMLKPFAPIHILRVLPYFDSQNGHFIMMDNKGKLSCPMAHDDIINNSYAVTDVLGVYPLQETKVIK